MRWLKRKRAAVEAWLGPLWSGVLDHWDRAERQNWVGIGVGFGLGGLVGVGAAIATAAHVEAGHGGALDLAGLAAAVAGPLVLGVLVLTLAVSALLPRD